MKRFFWSWVFVGNLLILSFNPILGENPTIDASVNKECELPVDQSGHTRAFKAPERQEAEEAAYLAMMLLALVFLGFSAIIILIAFYFEPSSKLHQSTEVKRGENFTAYKRSSRSSKNIRYHIDDEV